MSKGRPSVFADVDDELRQRIRARPTWPAAMLARELGCSRQTIYKHFPGRKAISSNEVLGAIRRHQSSGQGESR